MAFDLPSICCLVTFANEKVKAELPGGRRCWKKGNEEPVSTKKYSQNAKVELFYLVGMFRTLSQGDSISVTLRKLLQRGRRGSQAIYSFVTKGAGILNIKDWVSS